MVKRPHVQPSRSLGRHIHIASQTLHVHQAAFLVDHGVTAMVAASVISVVGGASIVGKTGGG
jgi:hypothetical protein